MFKIHFAIKLDQITFYPLANAGNYKQSFFTEHFVKLWTQPPNADVAWVCRTDIRMRPHVLLPLQHKLLLV